MNPSNRNMDLIAPDKVHPSLIAAGLNLAKQPIRRYRNPYIQGKQDVISQDMYDTLTVAASGTFASTNFFFQQSVGGTKTFAETNMTQNGSLPNPNRLFLESIACVVNNNVIPTDLINVLMNCTGELKIGNKVYWFGPLIKLPAQFGVNVPSVAQVGTAAAGSSIAVYAQNGVADTRNAFVLDNPFFIEQGDPILFTVVPQHTVTLAANNAQIPGTGITIQICLIGQLYRGVQ